MDGRVETATFAAGCFWCVEALFGRLKGVMEVLPGYAGGVVENPTYDEVCSGETGHAEVVRISYDPDLIGYSDLLDVFWRVHDPTSLNRQGADRGTQYRSAIFYHDQGQKEMAELSRKQVEAEHLWPDPVVTEIIPLTAFYPAEQYHRQYYRYNRNQPYCLVIIDPKMRKLQADFPDMLKEAGTLHS